jgi:hypothetical protein
MPDRIGAELQAMLDETAGVSACALVDAASGLVWHRCGEQPAENELLWEAAIDHWRLHERLRPHFASMGELGAVALHHRDGVLVILPCRQDTGLLVVCRADHRHVDWRGWQRRLRGLALDVLARR